MGKKHYKKKNTKNKNINKNKNEVHIHFNHHKQPVRSKTMVKRELVPQIRTFTPLHQMTNFVPLPGMPQSYQMTSHPSIPVQQPLVQNNPLVNPLRDISGRNRTIQDVFNDRQQLRDEAKKRQQEEIQKRIDDYKKEERKRSGKTIGELSMFVDEDKSSSVPGHLFPPESDSEHLSIPISNWEKEVGIPIRRSDSRPTPKKNESLIKETDSDYITDEFGNKFPKYEEKEDEPYKQETRGRKPKNKARDKYEENLSKDDYEELQRLEEIIGKSKGKKTKHPLYKKVKELKTKAYNKIK